jgi:hypothetical protein
MTIETKYNIGDEVWVKCGVNIVKGRIIEKNPKLYFIRVLYLSYPYILERTESEVFPTKEELLKSL